MFQYNSSKTLGGVPNTKRHADGQMDRETDRQTIKETGSL